MRVLAALFASTTLVAVSGGIRVAATIPTPPQPIGVAFGSGSAWTASFDFGGVIRVDTATDKIVARIKTGRGPIGVACGAGSVWVANWLENTVSRVNPATGKAAAKIKVTATGPEGMAFGAGALWVSNKSGSVSRIDPRTNRASGADQGRA
jgi:YVTN family beta-propeller protein